MSLSNAVLRSETQRRGAIGGRVERSRGCGHVRVQAELRLRHRSTGRLVAPMIFGFVSSVEIP